MTESPGIMGVPLPSTSTSSATATAASQRETISRHQRTSSTTSNSDTMQAMTLDSGSNENSDQDAIEAETRDRRLPNRISFSKAHSSSSSSFDSATPSKISTPSTSISTTAELCARLKHKELLPEDLSDPIMSLVDQMREQRMSSVANPGQYVFTYLALMAGLNAQLKKEGIVRFS